jgi:membrane protease subunit HflK
MFNDFDWIFNPNFWKTALQKILNRLELKFLITLCLTFFIWMSTGIFRVEEGQQGIVLRFGKFQRQIQPGLQYHLPWPMESVIIVNTDLIRCLESASAGEYLTSDENLVSVAYKVLWSVDDPWNFAFSAHCPDHMIAAAAASAVRECIAQNKAMYILTDGRQALAEKIQKVIEKVLHKYDIGIKLHSVQLYRLDPPAEVLNAFRQVQSAKEDSCRMILEAQKDREYKIKDIAGRVQAILQEGMAKKVTIETNALSMRARLEALGSDPQAARVILHMEIAKEFFQSKAKKILIPTIRLREFFS